MGVPVFGGRIPGYAAEKLTYLKGGGAVALTAAVYGNRAFEDALLELDDCLKAQGFRIGAGTALLAEHSMVRDVAAGRPDNQDRKDVYKRQVFQMLVIHTPSYFQKLLIGKKK